MALLTGRRWSSACRPGSSSFGSTRRPGCARRPGARGDPRGFKPGTAPPDYNAMVGAFNPDGSPVAVSPEGPTAPRAPDLDSGNAPRFAARRCRLSSARTALTEQRDGRVARRPVGDWSASGRPVQSLRRCALRKALERVGPEARADSHIGSIASARNQHATDARGVVTCVEGMPPAAQEHLKPGAEIHGSGSGGTPISPRYPVQ